MASIAVPNPLPLPVEDTSTPNPNPSHAQLQFTMTYIPISQFLPSPEIFAYLPLYDRPYEGEDGLLKAAIPAHSLEQIAASTGNSYGYGHLIKFQPGASMAVPLLVEDTTLLVAVRGQFTVDSVFASGQESPAVVLGPDQGVCVSAGTPVRIASRDTGTQDGFLAWLEHGNPPAMHRTRRRRFYTRDEREQTVFLVDCGFSARRAAEEIGAPCSSTTVLRWHKRYHQTADIRRRLQAILDEVCVPTRLDD